MKRKQLDEAIDATATRMTAVAEDEGLATRIAQALPDRRVGLTWILAGWAPRLAVLAAIAVAAALLNVQTDVQTVVPTIVPPIVQTDVQANDRANARMNARPNVRPNARMNDRLNALMNDRPNDPDHEFSLPALEAVAALGVDALTSANLAVDGPLTVESLQIADLLLTSESFSPR